MIDGSFTVCKISDMSEVDFAESYVFLSKTEDELSLVCESAFVPEHVIVSEPGWRMLKITDMLDFALVGVIAKISNLLAGYGISIFVVSTYNTDYILVKSDNIHQSVRILKKAGYVIVQ